MTYIERLLCAAVVLAFIAGVVIGRSGSKPSVAQSTKIEQKSEQISTLVVAEKTNDVDHKDVVTTTVKKPDGTTTTTTIDHSVVTDKTKEVENSIEKSKSTQKTTIVQNFASDKNYSLGLSYAPAYAMEGKSYSLSAFTPEFGYRLFSGLWIEAAYHLDTRQPTIGVRFEF